MHIIYIYIYIYIYICVCVCVFSSVIRVLRKPTEARRQQLRSDHEAAAALCLKLGVQSCKELRETRVVCFERLICWQSKGLVVGPGVAGHAGLGAASARGAAPHRTSRRIRPRRRAAACSGAGRGCAACILKLTNKECSCVSLHFKSGFFL